ncbi:uncharacterized protein [Epargyreus clarus]|uniref:uncharacterized protein n=1 Tax=Epargyreus clarus TaxID=520877 RepID=UPI003C2DF515
MSLLEDVFLQDEANEAEQLERVIEGDEFEERRRSDSDENSEKEDEAEEDKKRVDPTKPKSVRVIKNPRFILNPARLTGPRGIQVIPDHFKDFKFKGKGHEKEDLDLVLKKLEHWAYRLYPKFQFEDCLKKIEALGKKRPVAVHLHKIRSDQFLSEDTVVQKDSSDEDTPMPQEEDEFDKLLQQQIELARSTPGPNSAKKPGLGGTSPLHDNRITSVMMPKATSSPSINEEQRERMLRSRKLAEERRLARLKNATTTNNIINNSSSQPVITENEPTVNSSENKESNVEQSTEGVNKDDIGIVRKHNRSNVIDSSDEETVAETNMSITVDVHNVIRNNTEDNNSLRGSENNKGVSNDIDDKLQEHEDIICNSNSNTDMNNSIKNIDTDNVIPEGSKEVKENNESEFDNVLNTEPLEVTEKTSTENSGDIETIEVTKKTNAENSGNIETIELTEKTIAENSGDIGTIEMSEKTIADNSGDIGTLRYDDSDMDIDKDARNTSDNNGENTAANNSNFKETIDIRNENETENSSEKASNVENKGTAAEDDIEDIMDVDFSEDF